MASLDWCLEICTNLTYFFIFLSHKHLKQFPRTCFPSVLEYALLLEQRKPQGLTHSPSDCMSDSPAINHLFGPLLDSLPLGPFLQPVVVPLGGAIALLCISYFSQFCVIRKLSEGTHSVPSSRSASAGLFASGCSLLSPAVEPVLSLPHCLLI